MCGRSAENTYDVATFLSDDGFPADPKRTSHMTRGTLDLHSCYLTLWANYGALCVSLLMDPNLSEKLKEGMFSAHIPLRHYCFHRTQQAWHLLSSNLNITIEERVALVNHSLEGYYKVKLGCSSTCIVNLILCTILQNYKDGCHDIDGIYNRQDNVDVCETFLHRHCFVYAWEKIQPKVSMAQYLWW